MKTFQEDSNNIMDIASDDSGTDMIPDTDDLLRQWMTDADIGLPPLLDDVAMEHVMPNGVIGTGGGQISPHHSESSSGHDSDSNGSLGTDVNLGGLHAFGDIDQLLLGSANDSQQDLNLFPNTITTDDLSLDSVKVEPFSPKTEPLSPMQQQTLFPPSPTDSDMSSSSSNATQAFLPHQQLRPSVIHQPVQMYKHQQPILAKFQTLRDKIPIPKISKSSTATTSKVVSKPPLVLTSEQFAQLTQSGVLKVQQNGQVKNVVNNISHVQPTPATLAKPMASPAPPIVIKTEPIMNNPITIGALPTVRPMQLGQNFGDNDLTTLKRQQRMIKNRESACLSRKKKKEYLTNLEDQLNAMAKENQDLRRENMVLNSRIQELEQERQTGFIFTGRDSAATKSKIKKGTTLFMLLCFVSFNAHHLEKFYAKPQLFTNETPANVDHHIKHVGRSLLWERDLEANISLNTFSLDDQPSISTSSDCPMHFNQSESLRLETQLRGWFKQGIPEITNRTINAGEAFKPHKTVKTVARLKKRRQRTKPKRHQYLDQIKNDLPSNIYHMLITEPGSGKFPASNRGDLSVFNSETPRFTFESFFEAIERRDDTFYVVSFSGDHLLLPATSRNASVRPRMSLLMPTLRLNVNDSSQSQHVAMMQIDCEVMNTKLLHVKEDAIPVHLSAHMSTNHSAAASSNEDSKPESTAHLTNSTASLSNKPSKVGGLFFGGKLRKNAQKEG